MGKILFILLFIFSFTIAENLKIDFTDEEKAWIKNNPIIKIAVMNYWDHDNDGNSIHTDYLKLLNKYGNINIIPTRYNIWKDGYNEAIKGKNIHGIMNLSWSKLREEKYFHYTKVYYFEPNYLIVKKNNNNINSLEDLIGKKIYLKEKSITYNIVKDISPTIQIQGIQTDKQMYKKLFNSKDITGFISYKADKELLKKYNLKVANTIYNKYSEVSIGVNRSYQHLASIINKIYKVIPKEKLSALQSKIYNAKKQKIQLQINLTSKEKKYLKDKKIIKMCNNPNWTPIEFAQDNDLNNMQGIAIDTLRVIENNLNIKFKNIPTKSWKESQQFLKEKKCDILPCAVKTTKREKYANFTKPYLKLPLAIFTTKDKKVVSGLDEIMDKSWTRQKGSGLITKLKKDYPNMKIIETKGDKEALQYVNSGQAYFTISTLPVASHVISKYMLNDLHIAGYTGIVYNLSMAVRDDDKILLSILDKSLQNLSKKTSRDIFKKWVSASVKEPVADHKLIKQILFIGLIVILFFIYRQYMLNKSNNDLKKAVKEKTKELSELNKNLEMKVKKIVEENRQKDKILFSQSKMASMGEMISNIAHQWRQPLSIISTAASGIQLKIEYNLFDKDEAIEDLESLVHSAQYLSTTIDDFQNFLKPVKNNVLFNIKDVIIKQIDMFGASFTANDIEIVLNINDTNIYGNQNELLQVIINILNNAKDILKISDLEKKYIFIDLKEENNNAIISIKDNAKGIKKEILPKVFDAYFTTKHKTQGTGLGLYMSYQIISNSFNGLLEVSNKKYKYNNCEYIGAEFIINIPILKKNLNE